MSELAVAIDQVPVVGTSLSGRRCTLAPMVTIREQVYHWAALRARLHAVPRFRGDVLIYVDMDVSGSVQGGNDPLGRRNELVLVALEQLVARRSREGRWWVRLSTFDDPSVSSIELVTTLLDRNTLKKVRDVLLPTSAGGCSILGNSLWRAEREINQFNGTSVLCVLSDFELYDRRPSEVLERFANSEADEIVAISLTNPPPDELTGTSVTCAQLVATDDPVDLANHIIDAATRAAAI